MKTIQWNRRAVELAREQDVDDPLHAVCPGCGATPAMRQYGIYQCECGELEGFAPPRSDDFVCGNVELNRSAAGLGKGDSDLDTFAVFNLFPRQIAN